MDHIKSGWPALVVVLAVLVGVGAASYLGPYFLEREAEPELSPIAKDELTQDLEAALVRIVTSVGGGSVEAHVDGCMISWTQRFPPSVCKSSNTYVERSTALNVSYLETDPADTRLYENGPRVMVIYRYVEGFDDELRRVNKVISVKRTAVGDLEGNLRTLQKIEKEEVDVFSAGAKSYKYCSGSVSRQPLPDLQFTMTMYRDEVEGFIRMIDTLRTQVCLASEPEAG